MTIDRAPFRRLALALALMFVAAACAGETFGKQGGLTERQVDQLPAELHKPYQLFAQRCSRCHTLSRPLTAPITDFEHWKEYVARMRRQSGSGISPSDAEEILKFLKYYAAKKAAELGTKTSTAGAPKEGSGG